MSSNKQRQRRSGYPSDPVEHAIKIAESVDVTWHRANGSGRSEIAVSVVAALAFLSPPDDEIEDVADQLTAMDHVQFAEFMRMQWRIFIRFRPDLVNRAWLLVEPWLGERPVDDVTIKAAKEVADAALRAGQLHLTGTLRRRDADLFGVLLTAMRSRSARNARGQFYTPAPVTDLMAQMVGAPQEGDSVHEPAVGTGGFLRAVAKAMREAGRDPKTVTWVAVDIDELAVAALTVNVVLWELGHQVVLGVGDSLANDWIERALAERNETVQLAQMLTLANQASRLFRLIDNIAEPTTESGDQEPNP